MEAGLQGQHLFQNRGDHGVLLGQYVPAHGGHHVQGRLYLLPLAGGLELGVHGPEHGAAAHDEDAVLDELAHSTSKLCEVFPLLKHANLTERDECKLLCSGAS